MVKLHGNTVKYIFLNFPTQGNLIGRRNRCWKAALESLFTSPPPPPVFRNEQNWWRAFIFHPQKPQTRSDLSSARNILFARITSNEPVCWGLKQVLGTNLIPLRTKFDTQTTGMPVACYQSTLISETSFFRQWYFPWSGRSTNGILWGIVASSLFPCPRGFAARSCVLARLASLAQNKTACSQAIRRQV